MRQFDLMLDNTALAAQALLPLAGQPCDNGVKLALREQVTRRPFVRATTLSWQKKHLLQLPVRRVVTNHRSTRTICQWALMVMNGNPVTPDTALLVYRLVDGDKGAFASIDGYHLGNALRLISHNADLVLQVGPHWMSADGKVRDSALPVFCRGPPPPGVHALWLQRRMPACRRGNLALYAGSLPGVCSSWWDSLAHWRVRRLIGCKNARQPRPTNCTEPWAPMSSSPISSRWYAAIRARWAGCEVLMRWNHPKEGLVRPDLFIPLAEDCGLIVPMTRALLRQTAAQLAPHAERFARGFHIGVNITARHCQDLALVEDCRGVSRRLHAWPGDPGAGVDRTRTDQAYRHHPPPVRCAARTGGDDCNR